MNGILCEEKTVMNKKTKLLPRYLLFTVMISFSLIFFLENFVFGTSFSLLSFRNIDDMAFHSSLQTYHNCSGIQLLYMNDYGYGWLYWIIIWLITYPAHLLFEATGISWLLIVLPRMYSLALCIGCSVLCYKIVDIYTKNEWIKMAIVFLMPLYPTAGEFAGRFSTVPQVAFLSMLSIYLVIKKDLLDRKSLRNAMLIFALAMATKVSAIVTAPLLILLVLSRYGWRFTWTNIKVWITEGLLAVVVMLVTMSPIIALAPLDFEMAAQSWDMLLSYWLSNQTKGDVAVNFTNSILFTYSPGMALVLEGGLLLLAAYGMRQIKKNKYEIYHWDYVILPIGYFIGVIYLSFSIGNGFLYVFMYATSISFILPFGLLLLDHIKVSKERLLNALIVFVTIGISVWQIAIIGGRIEKKQTYNVFNYFQKGIVSKQDIANMRNMEEVVSQLDLPQVNYLIDSYSIINFYNSFEHDNVGYALTIFNNFGTIALEDANLIVLSKKSVGFYSDSDFKKAISQMDTETQEQYRIDRETRITLVETAQFLDQNWTLIYEDDNTYMFARLDK